MKIPVFIITLAVAALIALQGWTLNAVVDLKSDVAALKSILSVNHNTIAKN
jgi:hypothetical protein